MESPSRITPALRPQEAPTLTSSVDMLVRDAQGETEDAACADEAPVSGASPTGAAEPLALPAAVPPSPSPPSALCELLVEQQRRIGALQSALDVATRGHLDSSESRTPIPSQDASRGVITTLNMHKQSLHQVWECQVPVTSAPAIQPGIEERTTTPVTKGEAPDKRANCSTGVATPSLTSVIVLDVTSLFSCRSAQPATVNTTSNADFQEEGKGRAMSKATESETALEEAQAKLRLLEENTRSLRKQLRQQQKSLDRLKTEKNASELKCAEAARKLDDIWADVEAKQAKVEKERAAKDRELERLRILMRFSELKKDSDLLPNVAKQWDAAEHERRELQRENRELHARLTAAARCLEAVGAATASAAASACDPETRRTLSYVRSLCEDTVHTTPGTTEATESSFHHKAVSSQGAAAPPRARAEGPPRSPAAKPPLPDAFGSGESLCSAGPHRVRHPSDSLSLGSTGGLTDGGEDDAVLSPPPRHDPLSRVRRALMEARRASASTNAAVARHTGGSHRADAPTSSHRSLSTAERPSSSSPGARSCSSQGPRTRAGRPPSSTLLKGRSSFCF